MAAATWAAWAATNSADQQFSGIKINSAARQLAALFVLCVSQRIDGFAKANQALGRVNASLCQRKLRLATSTALAALLLVVVSGCNRPAQTPKARDFFATWLESRGESNIVVDAHGVGIAGNPTRLHCSLYDSEKHKSGTFTAESEFRVRLADGREIIEFVAGTGDSLEQAEADAKLSFVLTTFHVDYRSFMNPADSHQTEEPVTINGRARQLVMGDTMTRGESTNNSPDMFPMRTKFRELLPALPLSSEPHWIKIIFANHHSNVMLCAVTLDSRDNVTLTEAVRNLPWPRKEEFYMMKQFIVVK